MATTATTQVVYGGAATDEIVLLVTITSDNGAELTDSVIYDNSAYINNAAVGKVLDIQASGSSCQLTFEWDQTTDYVVCVLDPAASPHFCFRRFDGVANPNGAGATGDLVLTTANIDTGDVATVLITIRQK